MIVYHHFATQVRVQPGSSSKGTKNKWQIKKYCLSHNAEVASSRTKLRKKKESRTLFKKIPMRNGKLFTLVTSPSFKYSRSSVSPPFVSFSLLFGSRGAHGSVRCRMHGLYKQCDADSYSLRRIWCRTNSSTYSRKHKGTLDPNSKCFLRTDGY